MTYIYSGPVTSFGKSIGYVTNHRTTAKSKAKAKCNIEWQIKMELGLLPTARVSIDASKLKGEEAN